MTTAPRTFRVGQRVKLTGCAGRRNIVSATVAAMRGPDQVDLYIGRGTLRQRLFWIPTRRVIASAR